MNGKKKDAAQEKKDAWKILANGKKRSEAIRGGQKPERDDQNLAFGGSLQKPRLAGKKKRKREVSIGTNEEDTKPLWCEKIHQGGEGLF